MSHEKIVTSERGNISEIAVAVLAGGLGTRLQPIIADHPKVLAKVRGKPFLGYLLDQLESTGFRSVTLCIGYLGEQVYETFGARYGNLRLSYSHETTPLGTGGAVRLALPRLNSDPLLVMNGDSFCSADLAAFWEWFHQRRATAGMLLTRVTESSRYGSVKIDDNDRVVGFAEKITGAGPGWINAGVYLFKQEVLRAIPCDKNVSLENHTFAQLIHEGGLYGYPNGGRFLDIGTPEDFAAAEAFLAANNGLQRRRFIVLDRDGTIIEERGYLSDPEQLKLLSGVGAALREFQELGFGLIVITNQSGIGRGFFDERQLERIHERLHHELEMEGVRLDGIYFCPHTPQDACLCRKPEFGLIQKASKELNFDLHHTIVVGDKASDIKMGRQVGAVTFLVRTGYGAQVAAQETVEADFVVDDLRAAIQHVRRLAGREGSDNHGH